MNLKEIEKIVGSIQSHIFKNSNSFSIGMLKSHFKGSGLQFKEHQIYTPGDDVRFIDWKLSAKTNTTFVKTFEEERNVEIIVVLDIVESMLTGFRGVSKLQASIEIACLLFLLAEKSKDKVKIVLFSDQAKILPGMSGHAGIALFISILEKQNLVTKDGKINLNYQLPEPLNEKRKMSLIKSFIARNKEVVYLSDFLGISDFDVVNKLLYKKNMHCFKVEGPLDKGQKTTFSILTGSGVGKSLSLISTIKESDELKGRYRTLSVEDRYLESFVREML